DGRLEHLLAAEGEELARERRRAVGGVLDVLEPTARRIAGARLAQEEARAADDRGEEVVEVVGDAAGEPADRLHALRVAEPLGHAPPLLLGALLLGERADRLVAASPADLDERRQRERADEADREHEPRRGPAEGADETVARPEAHIELLGAHRDDP